MDVILGCCLRLFLTQSGHSKPLPYSLAWHQETKENMDYYDQAITCFRKLSSTIRSR